MKKIALAALGVLIATGGIALTTEPAEARVSVGIGIGGGGYGYGGYGYGRGCCGYAPYYAPYYYGDPAYYAPPAYYAAPAPTVIYQQAAPPPVTYVQPQPQAQYAPQQQYQPQYEEPPQGEPLQVAPGTQTSTTYTDQQGRTCRRFKSKLDDGSPVNGTACQTSDGNWHTVD